MRRRALLTAGICLAVSLLLLARAGTAALAFFPDLNLAAPPLARHQPVHGATGPALSRRVILIVIDGLSERRSHGLPFLDGLRRRGVSTVATSELPTISRPNYVAIMTGVPPLHSGVRNNFHHAPVTLDSILARVRAAGRGTFCVSDDALGLSYLFADAIDDVIYAPWRGGLLHAMRTSLAGDHSFVFLLPGAVDIAGHADGAAAPSYREAALSVDAQLGQVLAGVDLTRDTIIVTADHGHLAGGGHGGNEAEVVEVPFIMAGAGVRPGGVPREPRLVDVAPTVAALLGLPAPGHGLGRTLLESLDLSAGAAAELARADQARLAVNGAVVRGAAEAAWARLEPLLHRRWLLAGLATAAAFLLLAIGVRTGAVHLDARSFAIGAAGAAVPLAALWAMGWPGATLSTLPNEEAIFQAVGVLAGAALVGHAAFFWLALGEHVSPHHRLARVCGAVWCGLQLVGLPALWGWALWGGGPFYELPDPQHVLVVPSLLSASAAQAAGAGVLLGVEVIVYVARTSGGSRIVAASPRQRHA